MSGLISYPLDDGGHVLIEVEDDVKDSVGRRLHPGEIVETLGTKFETAIEATRPAALAVARNFREFLDAPKDVDVEIGLKVLWTNRGHYRFGKHQSAVPHQDDLERKNFSRSRSTTTL